MIRLAKKEDLTAVTEIYDAVLDREAADVNYTNWQKGLYPTGKTAEGAYQDGTLYLKEQDGRISATVILNHIQNAEYSKLPWKYAAEGKEVLVIHTLAVHPDFWGQGIAKEMVKFSEELAREKQCLVVRLDTYVGNAPAVALYESLGYRIAGIEDFLFQGVIPEQLYCLEKKL